MRVYASAQLMLDACALVHDKMPLCRDNDPELIKMMKKKMAVAISEENYDQAAQLRDSPLMTLYREIQRHKQNGDTARAAQLQRDLDRSSSGWDFP